MKISRATLHPYEQHLSEKIMRRGVWLRLENEDGDIGVGESAPWPGFGDGAKAWDFAVETAFLELSLRCSLVGAVREPPDKTLVPVHALVSSVDEALIAYSQGIRTFKIKVGRGALDEDARLLHALREALGNDVALWVDANGVWTAEEALHALRTFDTANIALAEQPVAHDDLAGMRWLRERVDMKIAADESVVTPGGFLRLLEMGAADVIVLKPMFLGGLSVTTDMARKAIAAGFEITITHALESSIGRHAAACVAASLDVPLLPCGFLGPLLEIPQVSPLVVDGMLDVESLYTPFDPIERVG